MHHSDRTDVIFYAPNSRDACIPMTLSHTHTFKMASGESVQDFVLKGVTSLNRKELGRGAYGKVYAVKYYYYYYYYQFKGLHKRQNSLYMVFPINLKVQKILYTV